MKTKGSGEHATVNAPRGRGRPQARPDEETRAMILDAARHEFSSAGFDATSMESVARRAGVSTKTLYRLMPNKAELFEIMITERIDRFASVVRLQECTGDIEAALCAALIACGELILDAEVIALQRIVLGQSSQFPDIAQTFYRKAMRRTEATLANWLKIQHERGLIVIDDATAASGMLLGMFVFQPQRATLYGRVPAPTRKELERRAQAVARLFLKGAAAAR